MYGDAPLTVSVSMVTVPAPPGDAFRFCGTLGKRYVNCLVPVTVATIVEILYSLTLTPRILIGVPTVRPCSVLVATETTALGVAPSPELMEEMLIGSAANAPTISHSGLSLVNASGASGNFCAEGICLPEPSLNAFDNLA